jgi:HEAT repeat protein
MSDEQLDLFSGGGTPVRQAPPGAAERATADWGTLDDDRLIAAVADVDLVEGPPLMGEIGRRKLARAIPPIEALCRRFAGFGMARIVPEQWAACEALQMIGGLEAARAVAGLIERHVVQGPTLRKAVEVAARLDAPVPTNIVLDLLRHDDPQVRADACRCTGPWPPAIPLLIGLLDDLQPHVAMAAACALGRLGRAEGRPVLLRLLRDQPSPDVIEAIVPIADEDAIVLLGRTARQSPDLADALLDALDAIDTPRARIVAGSIRGRSTA